MSSRNHRKRVLALGLALVIVLTAFAGLGGVRTVGAQIERPSSSSVAVTASNGYAFTPNTIEQVPTNSTITVTFTDGSALAHTFTILGKQGWVLPNSATSTEIDQLAYGSNPAALFNLNVTGSGDVETQSFNSPGPGWYEFICTEGGHFTYGMYGFIAFGMNLPSNLSVSSGVPQAGAALFIIIGSIVSLVVIALVLGFVFGRREGAKHEMPPERLGYLEPSGAGEPLPPAVDEGRKT